MANTIIETGTLVIAYVDGAWQNAVVTSYSSRVNAYFVRIGDMTENAPLKSVEPENVQLAENDGFELVDVSGGYFARYQEYPGAYSWPEWVPSAATAKCTCGCYVQADLSDPKPSCECGKVWDASRYVREEPDEEPADFDHWGGQEAPAGTYA